VEFLDVMPSAEVKLGGKSGAVAKLVGKEVVS
jgi:hypothetical protein